MFGCARELGDCTSTWVLANKECSMGNKILGGDLITGENNCEVLQNINQ